MNLQLGLHRHILQRSHALCHSVFTRAWSSGWLATRGGAIGGRGGCIGGGDGGGGSCCKEKSRGGLLDTTSLRSACYHIRRETSYAAYSFSTLTPRSISKKKRLVFLGTPDVSAQSLQMLVTACKDDREKYPEGGEVNYEIVAVVTQPPAPAGRNLKLLPSPVQLLAEKLRIPCLIPASAKDPAFLQQLRDLQPDLCITVAYGNFLPKQFLAIPVFGTLNIHPSLLPKYRGAAPVQRCLEAGEVVTGVSVAETVLKMDAGPIVHQSQLSLHGHEKGPDLLQTLIAQGTRTLINEVLPTYFDDSSVAGTADGTTSNTNTTTTTTSSSSSSSSKRAQDHSQACSADKISGTEAQLNFAFGTSAGTAAPPAAATATATTSTPNTTSASSIALRLHNRVRAFSGWPGCWCLIKLIDIGKAAADGREGGVDVDVVRMKIVTSMVLDLNGDASSTSNDSGSGQVKTKSIELLKSVPVYDAITGKEKPKKEAVLQVTCADGSLFGIVELQPPGKKVMNVKSYINGLRGRALEWTEEEEERGEGVGAVN